MSVTYACPHCKANLRTANPVPAGRVVRCPKCSESFTPVPNEADEPAAGVFKLADDKLASEMKSAKQRRPEPKPAAPPVKKSAPPPEKKPAAKEDQEDDEEDAESLRKGYGVQVESEEEIARVEANKPKFGDVKDKFKGRARGPAMALLVQPANLLTFEGFATGVAGIVMFIFGMWPLVFSELPPSPDEEDEAIVMMLGGLMVFGWGAVICVGASQMQNLQSYTWAMVGAVMGILPLLAGVYALAMLRNPKVISGFEEGDGGDDGEKDEDDEDEDEDDDEDDEGGDDYGDDD